jgi:hypothetical protein
MVQRAGFDEGGECWSVTVCPRDDRRHIGRRGGRRRLNWVTGEDASASCTQLDMLLPAYELWILTADVSGHTNTNLTWAAGHVITIALSRSPPNHSQSLLRHLARQVQPDGIGSA